MLFGKAEPAKVPEALLERVHGVAIPYRDFAISKLHKLVPPYLLGMVWGISCYVHEDIWIMRKLLSRDDQLRFLMLSGESLLFTRWPASAAWARTEIEEAKALFDSCRKEGRAVFERYKNSRKASKAVLGWWKESDIGAELIQDEGGVAFATLMGCLADSIASALKE